MSKLSSKLTEIYNELEQVAKDENIKIPKIMEELNEIYEDRLSVILNKEYKKVGVATEVYRKYGITHKIFHKIINRTETVTPKPQRRLKPFIYEVTKDYNITHDEYLSIAKFLEKKELTEENVLKKLNQLRKK